MKREYRASSEALEITQELGEPLKIVGYAAVFNQLSRKIMDFRERILPGAFAESLKNDVKAFVNHDTGQIIGRTPKTLSMREDEHGLRIEIKPANTTAGRDVVESIKRGDLDQMSFAFTVPKGGQRWDHDENGGRVRELSKVDLYEVSIVPWPAYPTTSVALAVRSLWPDGVPEEIEQAKQEAATPPAKPEDHSEPSAARKRLDDLEKQFGIKK
jgi:HK97 family phage prohead protease